MLACRFKKSYPETRRAQRSWDERFEALVKYKRQHGNCNVPTRYGSDTGLGLFVSKIKNGGIEVTDDQRARLSDLGFDWETVAQRREREWMELFAQYAENRSTVTSTNKTKLHGWVAHQRYLNSKGKLRPDRYQKLRSIGFDWRMVQNHIKPFDLTRWDKQWCAMYLKLVDFHSKHGHAIVPYFYKEDKSLGAWVRTQRLKYKDKELSAERTVLLNEIEFVWKHNNSHGSTSVQQKHWDDMFEILKDYKEIHGDVDVPVRRLHREQPLGRWLANQRKEARLGKLDQLRVLRLKSLGVEWIHHAGAWGAWGKYYAILEAFQKKHGHCVVPTNGKYPGLVSWIKSQIVLHERGELPAKRKARLDRLGFDWGQESSLRKVITAKGADCEVASSPPSEITGSLDYANSPWAEEVVSASPPYHLATGSPRPEEVLSSSASCPLAKAERQAKVVADDRKASVVIGALDAKAVKSAVKKALKKAPSRSMKPKHLRRHLREVFALPCTSRKRDLEELLDRAINLSFKIVKQEKVVTLLKHHAAKV